MPLTHGRVATSASVAPMSTVASTRSGRCPTDRLALDALASVRASAMRALALPRRPREAPINLGQLRLLAEIAVAGELDRFEMHARERPRAPTIDKRLAYLREKALVRTLAKARYHDAADHVATELGLALYRSWRGRRPHEALRHALDETIALATRPRPEPMNVGHLLVLVTLAAREECATDELRHLTALPKPTLVSRLRYLERLGLLERRPLANRGGATHASRYVATAQAVRLLTLLGGRAEGSRW